MLRSSESVLSDGLTCLPGLCWPGGPAPPCKGNPRCPGTRGAPGCGAARHCPLPTQTELLQFYFSSDFTDEQYGVSSFEPSHY